MYENEVMDLMSKINYGWVDRNNIKHINDFDTYSEKYILQSPKDIIKTQIGVCWDQVELERYYFKSFNNSIKTFFIVHYDYDKCPTHTFLTFEKSNKYYWFEHSWEKFRGIHEYNTLKDLLSDIKNKFIHYELNNQYNKSNLKIYEYTKPEYNISTQEFYKHCESGKLIDLENM
ncbi:MAG: hypothetical protein IKO49_03080 [Bacilli bacterium]|nr:hypothetical protein [Bacilli bacterium]